jgi:hypothetical protein
VLAAAPIVLQLALLALGAPAWALAAATFIAQLGISVHLALWFTVFQQQVPAEAHSRVSSYDALGSFVLIPLGMAIVGPVSGAIGVETTLWLATALSAACIAGTASIPAVWAIRRTTMPAP